jgi:hypothetical protein
VIYCIGLFWFVDQFFSCLARYLRTHAAHDRDAMLDAARKGYKPWWCQDEPKCSNLETAANFSDWIHEYLAPILRITKFQQFEIKKHEDGCVVAGARERCGLHSEAWHALDGTSATHSKVFAERWYSLCKENLIRYL